METEINCSLIILLSFVIGSLPFGWVFAKLWGVKDLRKVGSSNVGATNVVRAAGWMPGALTFFFDFLKGFIPMFYCAQWFGGPEIIYGFVAVLGHCYSPLLLFKGGKGVSSALGVAMGLNPWIGGACLLTYALGLATLKVSAMGSLFAMLTLLAGTLLFETSGLTQGLVIVIVLVVLSRHRKNWDQLLNVSACFVFMFFLQIVAENYTWAYQHEVTDFRGKKIQTQPKTIVALMPSIAESIAEFGQQRRLVGVPEHTRLVDQNPKMVSIGSYNRFSVEKVFSLHPDLVIASMDGNDARQVRDLERLGLSVLTLNTQSLADVIRTHQILAELLGLTGSKKPKKLSELESLLTKSNRSKGRVFVQIGWEPLVTISRKTFVHEIVENLGLENIFGEAEIKYPRPNPEEVIKKNPDVILICQMTKSGKQEKRAKQFWMRFDSLEAAKKKRIVLFPSNLLTKPGFSLLKGVQELKKVL